MRYLKFASLSVALGLLFGVGGMAAPRGSLSAMGACPCHPNHYDKEAAKLFNEIGTEANAIQDQLDRLSDSVHFASVDWETQADKIDRVRDHVNTIGKDLERLNEISAELGPQEQQEMNRIHPWAVKIADDTRDAIQLINENHNRTFATRLPDDYAQIQQQAQKISNTAEVAAEVAQASQASGAASSTRS